ncbi:MAG: MBL fold metallo-hydrolase [Candidatus Methanomethylicia archaeon]
MKITDRIHLVDESFCNVYIVLSGNGYLLIDAGAPENDAKILKYLNENNFDLNKCRGIIVTHHHFDHMGCLAKLKNKLKTRVIAHIEEAPYINGKKRIRRIMEVETVNVDLEVKDKDMIDDLMVIHTPGHTPGSICLYHQMDKAIFIGDLVENENDNLIEIPIQYSLDPIGNRRSIKKVYETLDFEILLPSHGKPIIGNAKEKMRILIDKIVKHEINV